MRCRFDGLLLTLDRELARASAERGGPVIELLRCRMGHSVRLTPPPAPRRRRPQRLGPKRCAVCGGPMPGAIGRRKYHAGACRRFVHMMEIRFRTSHPGQAWQVEGQPWYRGRRDPAAEVGPLPVLPDRIPAEWWQGYLASGAAR